MADMTRTPEQIAARLRSPTQNEEIPGIDGEPSGFLKHPPLDELSAPEQIAAERYPDVSYNESWVTEEQRAAFVAGWQEHELSNNRNEEQPGFIHFECPECQFSSVQPADFKGSSACPLCAGDSGHDVSMHRRTARISDKPEGRNAREQEGGR